jgi:CRP-like cAMP-binding protein
MPGYDRALYQTVLKSVPMFSTCTPEQLDHLAELGDLETFAAGQAVVTEGDEGDRFFVVTSGKVRVQRAGSDVASLGTGEYFGELALFDPAPRNATVVASEGPAALVSLTRSAFTAALDHMPSLRDALLHGMARRIHELDQRV